MATHTLGMLLFFLLFLTGFCLMLREMHWNYRWICGAAAVLLAVVSSSEKLREIFWVHWIMTALIMVGYICGYLSMANWRLSPIVCTSVVVSMAFVHWAISEGNSMNRIAGVLCIPVVCFCALSVWNVALLPKDYYKENTQYQLTQILVEHGLTYGYATF